MRCHELSTQKVKICVFKLSYLVPLLYLSDTINYQNNPENEDMFISVVTSGTISLLMRCHELSTQKVKICVFKLSYLVPLLYLSDTINYQNNPENEDMFISVVTHLEP